MIVCIQCAMEALLVGEPYAGEKDQDEASHMLRVHPDPYVTFARRAELEHALREIVPKMHRAFEFPETEH